MKKKLKRILSVLVAVSFSIYSLNVYQIAYASELYGKLIPIEAEEYASDNYKKGLDIVLERKDLYGISGQTSEFQLCEPYIVYDVNEDGQGQAPLYYFPIKDKKEDIVLVMAVFLTENGWSYSLGKDMAEELNEAEYLEEECVVYGDEDTICVENKDETINDENISGSDLKKFSSKGFQSKKKEIENNYSVDYDVSYDVDYEDTELSVEGSGFATATSNCRLLAVSNAVVNQRINGEQKGICWAATIATIYNYIMDKKISAKKVCDSINHDYSGGNDTDIKSALKYFKLDYNSKGVLGYSTIKTNIKAKKPVYMRTISTNERKRHAVTLIGYDERIDGQYISVWNSAKEDYETLKYDGESTSFGMSSYVFHWCASYSYK